MRLSCPALYLSLACVLPFALNGCSLDSTAAPSPETGQTVQGMVRGGQQPIVGSHVYLFAANAGVFTPNTTGYGNASVSLLTSGTQDTSGGATNGDYYVTTGVGGAFSISGDYTCTGGQQVYLYALGGTQGAVANPVAGLLTALGTCPGTSGTAGSSFSSGLYLVVNEVSTIAAAYSFAGFATDATHVSSSGTSLAQAGIQNAFANAANLASLSTGAALATTPAGNGTVPQKAINTLANVLAACVNSNGAITGPASPAACYTLFNSAQSAGSSGTVPGDTATAAINLAHNPGVNLGALYPLGTPTPPFAPALTAQPNDFTVALNFTGGGMSNPDGIAIDASGNAWVSNYSANVTELAVNTGIATQFTGGGLAGPQGVAVDPSGNVWVSNFGNASVTKLNGVSGTAISGANGYTGGGLKYPSGIAIDGSGNVWVGDYAYGQPQTNGIAKLNGATGVAISGSTGYKVGGVNTPLAIAIDGSGNVWASNYNNTLSKLNGTTAAAISPSNGYAGGTGALAIDGSGNVWNASNASGVLLLINGSTGAEISPAGGYSGGGISGSSESVAIDGAGNAWVGNYVYSSSTSTFISNLAELKGSNGAAISPSSGYTGGGIANPYQIAIDGSGNLWSANFDNNSVTELIGAATPVVTPLSVGAKNNTLGTRP
jgi:streptogramin lyase